MLEEAAVVARGGEPKDVIRDPAKNHKHSPAHTRQATGIPSGAAQEVSPRPMLFHAGQPRKIVEEIERVWAERRGARQR